MVIIDEDLIEIIILKVVVKFFKFNLVKVILKGDKFKLKDTKRDLIDYKISLINGDVFDFVYVGVVKNNFRVVVDNIEM